MPRIASLKFADRAARSIYTLALFAEGEVKLTEPKFDALFDHVTAFLEEVNNHRFRFGRTIPEDPELPWDGDNE